MFARMGLSNRLNLIVISLNLVVLFIVAALAASSSDAALRSQAIDRFSTKHSDVVTRLDATLQNLAARVTSLGAAVSDFEDLGDAAALRAMVLTHLPAAESELEGLIFRISVVRPDGSIGMLLLDDPDNLSSYQWRILQPNSALSVDTLLPGGEGRGEAPWFVWMEPYADPEQRVAVSVVYPYNHTEGPGTVFIDIDLKTLHDAINDELNREGLLSELEHGYVLLIDQNNIPLTEHDVPETDELESIVLTILERHSETERSIGGLYRFDDPLNDEQPGLFAIGRLMVNNWQLISVLPEDEIPVLPSNILAPIIVVAVVGVIILVVTVNRFIDQSVVRPLVDLGRSAAEIGEGNLRFIVFHQDKQDEIGTLANAMDSMRSRLKESYDALQEWGRLLEARVEERTQQLAIAQQRAEENAAQLRAVHDESLSVVNETQLGPVLDAFIGRMVTLLDAAYCAVWLLTPDKQQMQLVATNDSRRKGESFPTISIHEGIVGQAIALQEPVLVDDYRLYERRVVLAGDDSIPFVRGVCAPLMFAGQPAGAVVVGRPESASSFTLSEQRYLTLFANLVSPSVRNAQLLVQLQEAVNEARRANEVKTRFLASVTHELRTPLNLIINNMDFMRVGAFGDVTDEQINRLNQTVRSAEHLLYLINDLLDVSKIEAGEMQLFIQKHEIYTMLEDASDNAHALLESYGGKDNIELRVEIEDNIPEIPMDARRIRQVLNNLLSNAIKFTQEGSVTLKVFKLAAGVHFSVHDTGMGIPADEMDLLFTAFERTTPAKQKGIEGTGLGLPISRYLIQQHGSDLTIVSEVGAGSTFAFTLYYELPETVQGLSSTDTQQITAILSSRSE